MTASPRVQRLLARLTAVAAADDRLHALWLGRVPYPEAGALQEVLAAARADGRLAGDVLLLLEHPHVFTLGANTPREHLLWSARQREERGVTVHHTNRGGLATYHGPGQLVGYPIVHLRALNMNIRTYVGRLEASLVNLLAGYGITARGHPRDRGVWVGGAKVAAVGVRYSRGVTSHGFALNVTTDLSYFQGLVPCGFTDGAVTSMAEILGSARAKALSLERLQLEAARSTAAALQFNGVTNFALRNGRWRAVQPTGA